MEFAAIRNLGLSSIMTESGFDRMVPSMGGIALRRLGASTHAVQTLLITREKMSYLIRTMMGTIEERYSNLQNWVLGTLKGSGASPELWLGITPCILLGAISKKSRRICCFNPENTRSLSRVAENYVDDTELMLVVVQRDISKLAAEMQIIAQQWEQLLNTTGAALVLEKCFYMAFD